MRRNRGELRWSISPSTESSIINQLIFQILFLRVRLLFPKIPFREVVSSSRIPPWSKDSLGVTTDNHNGLQEISRVSGSLAKRLSFVRPVHFKSSASAIRRHVSWLQPTWLLWAQRRVVKKVCPLLAYYLSWVYLRSARKEAQDTYLFMQIRAHLHSANPSSWLRYEQKVWNCLTHICLDQATQTCTTLICCFLQSKL